MDDDRVIGPPGAGRTRRAMDGGRDGGPTFSARHRSGPVVRVYSDVMGSFASPGWAGGRKAGGWVRVA
jgi:hypothetical protein